MVRWVRADQNADLTAGRNVNILSARQTQQQQQSHNSSTGDLIPSAGAKLRVGFQEGCANTTAQSLPIQNTLAIVLLDKKQQNRLNA
jgi:hypothetical protein